jgi:hypothetical protein
MTNEPSWYADLTPAERDRVRVARIVNADPELKKLGADMIHEGRWSEFYQKGDRNLYMKEFHHGLYMELSRKYDARRRHLEALWRSER